jgi:hypothetical protein
MKNEQPDTPRDALHSEAVLHAPLKALRAEMAQMSTPYGIEQHLMSSFKRAHPPKKWYQGWTWMQWGMAGGVGTVATMVIAFMLTMQVPLGNGPLPLSADEGSDFIALESLDRIEQESGTHVVQADVQRSELAALGVTVTPENANDSVRAELLVNEEGKALAVRFSE